MHSKLGELQQRFLQAFFSKENRFFLTGGAALAGFHLGHRETHDLDLFTLMDAMEEGSAAVAEVAREMGAKLCVARFPSVRTRKGRNENPAGTPNISRDGTF